MGNSYFYNHSIQLFPLFPQILYALHQLIVKIRSTTAGSHSFDKISYNTSKCANTCSVKIKVPERFRREFREERQRAYVQYTGRKNVSIYDICINILCFLRQHTLEELR